MNTVPPPEFDSEDDPNDIARMQKEIKVALGIPNAPIGTTEECTQALAAFLIRDLKITSYYAKDIEAEIQTKLMLLSYETCNRILGYGRLINQPDTAWMLIEKVAEIISNLNAPAHVKAARAEYAAKLNAPGLAADAIYYQDM